MKNIIIRLFLFAVFVAMIALVVVGQRQPGALGIAMMLAGVCGLLIILWIYNLQYK